MAMCVCHLFGKRSGLHVPYAPADDVDGGHGGEGAVSQIVCRALSRTILAASQSSSTLYRSNLAMTFSVSGSLCDALHLIKRIRF